MQLQRAEVLLNGDVHEISPGYALRTRAAAMKDLTRTEPHSTQQTQSISAAPEVSDPESEPILESV